MPQTDLDLIWVLDNEKASNSMYQQTLGLQYTVKSFPSVDVFMESLAHLSNETPRLLIADPENTKGSLVEAFQKARAVASKNLRLPDFMIVSRVDELDLIRFYLKAGARDYILKPLHPGELIAKVERALQQMGNREILILRNDLDGIQITDLTFREHQLLTIFLSRPERRVPRDELYGAIWSKVNVNRKTLDVHLFNLRRKLRPYGYDIFCESQVFSLLKQPVVAKEATQAQ